MNAAKGDGPDLLTAGLFIGFGALGLWLARGLDQGTLAQMGAGFLPHLVCTGLVLLGGVVGVAGLRRNAAAQSSFIPLLTLGIPSNTMMAMMLSAFLIHGITPGPTVLTNQPEIFWGLVASMWIGNALLVFINMPLIGLWVKLLTVPYRLLYPAILLFCCVGVYSMNNRVFDVLLAAGFGHLGYAFRKAKCEPGPLLLGFVRGALLEANLRRTLLITQGDPAIFVERPISLTMLAATVILLALMVLPSFRKKREEAFQEEEA